MASWRTHASSEGEATTLIQLTTVLWEYKPVLQDFSVSQRSQKSRLYGKMTNCYMLANDFKKK